MPLTLMDIDNMDAVSHHHSHQAFSYCQVFMICCHMWLLFVSKSGRDALLCVSTQLRFTRNGCSLKNNYDSELGKGGGTAWLCLMHNNNSKAAQWLPWQSPSYLCRSEDSCWFTLELRSWIVPCDRCYYDFWKAAACSIWNKKIQVVLLHARHFYIAFTD